MKVLRREGRSVPFAVAACLAVAVGAGLSGMLPGCKAKAAPWRSRDAAGASALRDEFLTRHQLKGRVALIEFGTIGCRKSEAGLEEMAFLQEQETLPGLAYVRVEASDDDKAVEEYYRAKEVAFPVHRDPGTKLAQAFDATVYPTFVLVGKYGRVRYRGKLPGGQLDGWVKALQAEKTDPGPNVPLLGTVTLDAPKLLAETRLPDLAGTTHSLEGLLQAEGLVLLFADTTCPYSGQAVQDMPIVSQALSGHGIPSVVVNIGDRESKVRQRYGRQDFGAAVLLYDPTDKTKEAWHVNSVPRVVYVDPDKAIAYDGKALWGDLAAAIQKARGMPPGTIRFAAKGTRFG
jgi:hypothetical protein